ncbi:MAG: type II toxin-antitoxin system HicA family toxin [Geminicoccaceae bacterium]
MPPFAMALNKRQCAVLCAVFAEPTRSDLAWADFERLVVALGGEWVKPGHTGGSRRRAALRGRKGLFHAPHPGPTMKKGSVESAREFLLRAGVTPQSEGCRC